MPVELPESTNSPYDLISNAPIISIIDPTRSVQIRFAPLNEIIDLTEHDKKPWIDKQSKSNFTPNSGRCSWIGIRGKWACTSLDVDSIIPMF